MRLRHVTAIVLAALGLFVGCDAVQSLFEAPPSGSEAAPRPEQISFEVDDDLYYVTRGEDGTFRAVTELGEVPLANRGTVYVYPSGFMPDLHGRKTRHVANLLEANPGDETVAKLRGPEFIDASEHAGRTAARWSSRVTLAALNMAPSAKVADDEPAADTDSSARNNRPTPLRGQANRKSGIKIEVVGGSMEPGGGSGQRAAQSLPDVTIYYADWCKPCHTAMDWMDARGVPYRAVDIEASDENRREMADFCREKGRAVGSVPTLRIGDDIMTGWNASRFQQIAGM